MSDKKSKLELIKEQSRHLRGTIVETLGGAATHFEEPDKHVLKFHGLYEQDDRDSRAALRKLGTDKAYSFMVRSKIPGGRLTAEQYLVHDDLARRHGNGTLRITTRQDIQLHGVIKQATAPVIRAIDRALLTTLGACGDVVRNVMCCPVPGDDPLRNAIDRIAGEITERFAPHTTAYHEIWLDKERVNDQHAAEPLYGTAYLPRKFKMAIAYPGDNCVDVYTQDVGMVPLLEDGTLAGFHLLIGGGLGMTHNKPRTFPRLADPLTWVRPDELLEVLEAIVLIQRDHGDRADRRHARLKYLIHDRGLGWFRREVEERVGRKLRRPVSLSHQSLQHHLGWHRQDDRWYRGLFVENGRVRDGLRDGIRAVLERYDCDVRLTPNQDILLTGIAGEDRAGVDLLLAADGIGASPSTARSHSMACPALPTCGLALAEAERALPSVIDQLEPELERLGLADDRFTIRMTGCPNGCARPYVADLAFVGRSAERYVILVGGSSDGTRLNQVYEDLVPRDALVPTVLPLLEFFARARERENDERFGDFCDRVGVRVLRAYAAASRGVAAHG